MELPALSRDQVREVDQIAIEQFGIAGVVLMENAGRGAAEIIHRLAPDGLIAILCGGGNNGGDGYVIARHLELLGRPVRLLSLVALESLKGDAKINAEIAHLAEIEIRTLETDSIEAGLEQASTIVDCLLGTGARGELREPFAAAVSFANECNANLRVAIDVPSGLDCDTGEPCANTFRANHTITFVAQKIGFQNASSTEFTGEVHEVGIGVPLKLLKQLSAK
ncbi:MAG: NAD(P)H-hydrate epimerase [Rubripirellula sp.]